MMPDREECMNPENKPYHHEGCPYNEECAVRNSIDKKNVIRGLEVCVDRDPGKYTCDQCPYENDGNDCEIHLTHDALALLKEQEAVEPKAIRMNAFGHPVYACGKCELLITESMNYCHQCGKRIEWEGR